MGRTEGFSHKVIDHDVVYDALKNLNRYRNVLLRVRNF